LIDFVKENESKNVAVFFSQIDEEKTEDRVKSKNNTN